MSGATTIDQGRPPPAALTRMFERHIAPHVAELERERRRLRGELLRRLVVAALVVAAAAALAVALFAPPLPMVLFLAGMAALVALASLYQRSARRYRALVRERVMPPVCAALGGLRHGDGAAAGLDLEHFARLGVIGSTGTRRRLDDRFGGRHRDTEFDMVEAEITSGSGKHKSTVFRGLLFSIAVPVAFTGEVVIAREHGRIGNAVAEVFAGARRGRTRVAFDQEHPAFERLYAVYADVPAEARRLLTPGFLDAMVALAESHQGRGLAGAFSEGRFLLALPLRRNLFEVGGLFRPAAELAGDLHRLVDDIGTAHRLIDFLHGDRPARLA